MNRVGQYIKATNAFARSDYLLIVVSLVCWLAMVRQMQIHWVLHPVDLGLIVGILFYSIAALGPTISLNRWTATFSGAIVGRKLGEYSLFVRDGGRTPFLCDGPTLAVMCVFALVVIISYTVEERKARRIRQASE